MGEDRKLDGAELIAAERLRQKEKHGFDAKRDDGYVNGELLHAAMHFASPFPNFRCWPQDWDKSWDKKDQNSDLDNLVVAGALIAAEIDRRLRKKDGAA